jgi:CBS domain containing-hemolysin-like protein
MRWPMLVADVTITPSMIAYVLLRVFLVLLLIAANAFFAAAEFALVSVRETRIQQLIDNHRIGARAVQNSIAIWMKSSTASRLE